MYIFVNVLDVFWTSYVRSIYVLCLWGTILWNIYLRDISGNLQFKYNRNLNLNWFIWTLNLFKETIFLHQT